MENVYVNVVYSSVDNGEGKCTFYMGAYGSEELAKQNQDKDLKRYLIDHVVREVYDAAVKINEMNDGKPLLTSEQALLGYGLDPEQMDLQDLYEWVQEYEPSNVFYMNHEKIPFTAERKHNIYVNVAFDNQGYEMHGDKTEMSFTACMRGYDTEEEANAAIESDTREYLIDFHIGFFQDDAHASAPSDFEEGVIPEYLVSLQGVDVNTWTAAQCKEWMDKFDGDLRYEVKTFEVSRVPGRIFTPL